MSIPGLDEDSKRILATTLEEPMTIKQLSTQLDIPVAICAKIVLQLKFKGLLKRTIRIDKEDNHLVFYQRTVSSDKIPPET